MSESDRLTDDERNQIRHHRPSCPCGLCQRHRAQYGRGSERERLILERCEQILRSDRLSNRLFPITPEFITATEIEQAKGSLNPTQWQQEYLAELPPAPQPPRRTFVILAGSHHQANHWRMDRGLTWDDCICIRDRHDLRGRSGEDCELVRVGEWWRNPLVDSPELATVFPDWQNSPIEDAPPQPRRHSDIRLTIQLSEEACQHSLDAFRYTLRSCHRYGKSMAQQAGQIEAWCERNGYTEMFWQEGQWWAFPPSGVMPVQLADVMGEGRSPF